MKKSIILSILLLCSCSAIAPTSSANNVIVSPNPPPKGCKYIGQVVGNQGNAFSGGFTSNENLEQGAMNDLRNKASSLGANYVQLITNRAGNTGGVRQSRQFGVSGGMAQTNVTNVGNAYSCSNVGVAE
jgi:hypothetical protein